MKLVGCISGSLIHGATAERLPRRRNSYGRSTRCAVPSTQTRYIVGRRRVVSYIHGHHHPAPTFQATPPSSSRCKPIRATHKPGMVLRLRRRDFQKKMSLGRLLDSAHHTYPVRVILLTMFGDPLVPPVWHYLKQSTLWLIQVHLSFVP